MVAAKVLSRRNQADVDQAIVAARAGLPPPLTDRITAPNDSQLRRRIADEISAL